MTEQERKSGMIVAGLMLAYAMDRSDAEDFLDEFEGAILTEGMQSIQRRQPPEYLRGWFNYFRRMAWLEGRNEAIGVLFGRLMRTHSRQILRREKRSRRWETTPTPIG